MNQRFMKMTFWLALAALATTLGWSRLPAGRAGQVYVDHPELRPSQVPNGRARHVYGDPPDNCSWRRLTTGSLVIEDYEVDLHQDWVHFPLTGYPSDEVLNGFPSKYLLQIEARPLPVVQDLPPRTQPLPRSLSDRCTSHFESRLGEQSSFGPSPAGYGCQLNRGLTFWVFCFR